MLSGEANGDGLVRGCASVGGSVMDTTAGASIIENDSFGNPGPYPTVSSSSSSSGNRFSSVGGFRTPPMTTRGLGSCVAEETVG